MPSGRSSTAGSKLAPVPLSTVFCADDADVIIRAAGARDFYAHKYFLSFVSPFFKDMFTIPQPPIDPPGAQPRVDVDESAETWENILRTIYPMPHPIIDNLDDLESLLLAAKKYEMQPIINIHKKGLENRAFMEEDPLRLYTIAYLCGLEDQAKHVARNAELLMVTRHFDAGDPKGLTLGSYHSLVSFLAERDNEWNQVLSNTRVPYVRYCSCEAPSKEDFYDKIKRNLQSPYLETGEAYLKALEDRSQPAKFGCGGPSCAAAYLEIKGFIERMVKQRESLRDKFMCEKQYVQ